MALAELPPMSLAISDDSCTLLLQFDAKLNGYSAEQVETLMIVLALHRARMQPSVPSQIDQLQPDRVLVADAYRLRTNAEHSSFEVWLQLAGFGWATAEIPAQGLEDFHRELGVLLASASPPPNRSIQ